jgi:PAS domain S-box-containing protein
MTRSSLTDIQISVTNRLVEALQTSENQMRRRLDLLRGIVFELNEAGEIIYWNDAWERNLGSKPSRGSSFSDYIYPLDAEIYRDALNQHGTNQAQRSEIAIRFQHIDGRLLLMNTSLVSMNSGIVGALHDVTEEVQIKKALKATIQQVYDDIESINDAFSLFDADDKLVICNAKYAQTFTPYNTFEEIKGNTFEELVRLSLKHKGEVIEPAFNGDQEAWIKERIRRHRNPEEVGVTEVQLGPEKWVQVREKRTSNGGIIGIRTDISELKMIQRTLEEAVVEKNQLLKSMATLFKSNSMGSMVSSLAHEINSPLGAVSLNAELLKMELTEYIERHQLTGLDKAILFADQIFLGTQKTSLVVSRLRSLFTHGEDQFELFDLTP